MADNRIAVVARSILSRSTRRGAILGVGRAATVLPIALLPAENEAKKRGKRKKRCCKANCVGKTCGDDGCGGVCGFVCQESEPGKICCEGLCKYPNGTPSCCIPSGELCTPDGGITFGSYVCCSKSCDTGAGHTNLCN